jgi:hypothetical protein
MAATSAPWSPAPISAGAPAKHMSFDTKTIESKVTTLMGIAVFSVVLAVIPASGSGAGVVSNVVQAGLPFLLAIVVGVAATTTA